jgi:hypothetical protein
MNKKLVRGWFLTFLSFVLLIAPSVSLFIMNYEVWVQDDAVKISMGAMLGMLYAIIVMRGALKEISPKTATLMSMFVFLSIIWFLDSIVEDLFWVVLSVIVGYIMYTVVSSIGQQNINEYKSYKDEKTRIKARKEAQEDIVGV